MFKNKKVILIVPFFNEKGRIAEVIKKTEQTSIDEVCAVDDGSADGGAATIKEMGVTLLSHPERKGVGAAIRTGIKHALTNNFDIIVVCAGNDKDNPKEVDRLLKPIIEEDYDYIHGSRFLKGGRWGNLPFYRLILAKVSSFLFSLLVGQKFTDVTNGFRAYKIEVIKDPRINLDQEWLNTYELESYLQYKAIALGYKFKEVPVSKIYPTKKTTKMKPFIGWWKMVKPIVLLKLKLKR